MKSLNVWMNGKFVGVWSVERNRHLLAYDNKWITSAEGRPLSLSMPLKDSSTPWKGDVVKNYFENLLPENINVLKKIAEQYKTRSLEVFEILEAIGRDCIGAVQLLPERKTPDKIKQIKGRQLKESEIAGIIKSQRISEYFSFNETDDFRISIAGTQLKTALLKHKNKWYIPSGQTPTTHILKLPIAETGTVRTDFLNSVENEWLCLKLLAHYGIPVCESEIAHFLNQKVLIVKRFDRKLSADKKWIIRIPQEDMCQVFGISSYKKYQSEGGPGICRIMNLLDGSRESRRDREIFFKTQILFFLLSAIDGHAKNFSIFIEPGGRFALTPVYDVLSMHPVMGTKTGCIHPKKVKMAMAFYGKNTHYHWADISSDHFYATAKMCGLPAESVSRILDEIIAATKDIPNTVLKELPDGFPENVAESIFSGVYKSVKKIEKKL